MKLPVVSSRKLCSFLEKEGFIAKRQRGSHRFFEHKDKRCVVVPVHSGKNIKRGLLKAILNEINMTREEFFEKFK